MRRGRQEQRGYLFRVISSESRGPELNMLRSALLEINAQVRRCPRERQGGRESEGGGGEDIPPRPVPGGCV